jgi:beta-phosphoglucomutase-like phosphatase (HAD superfamily)
MTLRTIRAAVFDMDGVLTDSEPLINAAAIEMFREKGLKVRPQDFQPFIGTGEDRYIGGVAELYQFPSGSGDGEAAHLRNLSRVGADAA